MMNIRQYLDSTYLKTATQAGISVNQNTQVVKGFVSEAITENYKLIMIRPDQVSFARQMIVAANSTVLIGTVIDFPEGKSALQIKLDEAQQAIADGVDELDFVCNYEAFILGDTHTVKEEIISCTQLGLSHLKTVKWIIEVAALEIPEIEKICAFIKHVVLSNFTEDQFASVFVKSSTGFYKTQDGAPNGATLESVIVMLENASPLPVKAAGGVRTYEEAVEMINLGVKRIGTSAAKAIANGEVSNNQY